jgi:hypothetical protein
MNVQITLFDGNIYIVNILFEWNSWSTLLDENLIEITSDSHISSTPTWRLSTWR